MAVLKKLENKIKARLNRFQSLPYWLCRHQPR